MKRKWLRLGCVVFLLAGMATLTNGCASAEKKSGAKKTAQTKAKKAKKAVLKKDTRYAQRSSVPASGESTQCKSPGDVRTIDKSPREDGGCEVGYTKQNQREVVAWAENQLEHCDEIHDRIVGKLKDAGFECE